jgi:hypothetical protein
MYLCIVIFFIFGYKAYEAKITRCVGNVLYTGRLASLLDVLFDLYSNGICNVGKCIVIGLYKHVW